MAKNKESEYAMQYDKQYSKIITIKINRKTEPEILDKILSVGNVNGYIKSLIKQDIENKQ